MGNVFHWQRGALSVLIHAARRPLSGANPAVGTVVESPASKYQFLGKLLGKALYEGILVEPGGWPTPVTAGLEWRQGAFAAVRRTISQLMTGKICKIIHLDLGNITDRNSP